MNVNARKGGNLYPDILYTSKERSLDLNVSNLSLRNGTY